MYNRIILLHTWNENDILNQLYVNKKISKCMKI